MPIKKSQICLHKRFIKLYNMTYQNNEIKLSKQINIIGKCYLIRKYEHEEKNDVRNKTV